ncbi:DNA primase [Candidatus Woesearchaeota archaeon]|nr:DNA primase [Candidatus Woesearchaeota archaeon]
MAKISQVSAKYIVHSNIEIDGVVDRPDVIGAIFGQTEGLLGADLELRELQRSGRIGRIEVDMNTKGGKTSGTIVIPSSLDKAETSIIAASLEIIQRIGPCNAKIKVTNIEDIRISKREFVINRAKELLKNMISATSPDSQELSDEVANSVRVMEITDYGPDKLPAGPSIDESDEIIIVEGRADVINLLKQGFKNVISTNGTTQVSNTIIELSKKKICTIFTDGDRGGDLIIKALLNVCEVDFVTKAPDGKEVEEITKKEIHKSLRGKIAAEQIKLEIDSTPKSDKMQESSFKKAKQLSQQQLNRPQQNYQQRPQQRQFERRDTDSRRDNKERTTDQDKAEFKKLLEDLVGTNGAYILNEKKEILGKVPVTELNSTIKSLGSGVFAVVLDSSIDPTLIQIAEKASVQYVIGMESKVKTGTTRIKILTVDDL